jgi:hypothetical protein
MPTTRPFAFNPGGGPVPGATSSGNIAVGTASQDYSTNPGGLTWFMGPDEDLGYIAVLAVTGGNYPTPSGSNNGTVEFWRSTAKTDEAFQAMANVLSNELGGPGPFASAAAANTWMGTANLWTSWVAVTPFVGFSGSFTQSVTPSTGTEQAWNTFRASLTGTYTTFTLTSVTGGGSAGISGTHPTKVQLLANAIKGATSGTPVGAFNQQTILVSTGATMTWTVGVGCGTPKVGGASVEFTNSGYCSCGTGAGPIFIVRPMINNANWGGFSGSGCGGRTQVMTLSFT